MKGSKRSKKRVFVAMSGGVDSSVAAALLKKRGFDVVGCHMRCWSPNGCNEQDATDARRVAEELDIPFYVLDFEKEYRGKVVDYMIGGYRDGITPNPDVMCNKEIKFGLFLKKALAMGADYIATGHYVKIASSKNKKFTLREAKDKNKDQSYFLWTLAQNQLKYCLFPIGGYLKSEVREMARKFGLPTAEKKDSQGICFVGKVNLADFLKNYIPEKRGAILTVADKKIGEHRGAHFYTVGQRHIGVDAKSPNQRPHYVVAKDMKTNAVIVAEGDNHPALYKTQVTLKDVNLTGAGASVACARVRYRQPLFDAKLNKTSGGHYELAFGKPQKFVAPGQSAVFYSKTGLMLGGGIIRD